MKDHTTQHKQEEHADLAAKVFGRIKDEKIAPRSRWHFVLHNYTLWALWGVSIIVGALAVAANIFVFANFGWQLYAATHNSFMGFVLDYLPYLWLVTLCIFVFIAYENMRHTKRGYRYPLWVIVAVSILASGFGGVMLYTAGVGQFVDSTIGKRIPLHRPFVMIKTEHWVSPERGLLAGEVVNADETSDIFVLRTFEGVEWTIETSSLMEPDWRALNEFSEVRVIGVPLVAMGTERFHACFVLPWELHGRMMQPAGPRPHQLVTHIGTSSPNERKVIGMRSSTCKDVRLYDAIHQLRN
jgi:hypothetical protein